MQDQCAYCGTRFLNGDGTKMVVTDEGGEKEVHERCYDDFMDEQYDAPLH